MKPSTQTPNQRREMKLTILSIPILLSGCAQPQKPAVVPGYPPVYMPTNSPKAKLTIPEAAASASVLKRDWHIHIDYPADKTNFTNWTLQQSDDGTNWVDLQTFQSVQPWQTSGSYDVHIPTNSVRMWRMKGTK